MFLLHGTGPCFAPVPSGTRTSTLGDCWKKLRHGERKTRETENDKWTDGGRTKTNTPNRQHISTGKLSPLQRRPAHQFLLSLWKAFLCAAESSRVSRAGHRTAFLVWAGARPQQVTQQRSSPPPQTPPPRPRTLDADPPCHPAEVRRWKISKFALHTRNLIPSLMVSEFFRTPFKNPPRNFSCTASFSQFLTS